VVYELVFDMDAGTFSDVKVEVLESVASGKPVNTSYTTIRNGKHTIYFKAATNEIFLRFTPQTNLTGSRSAYINYITLRRVSSRPAPGSIVYTENMTLTSRTGNTPSTYTASNSITFDSGFESGTSDEFQTFVEPTIFVSDGMERDDYRFGFNGMEKDDEMKGSGNSYDFGARIYDSRLGRWLSLDPQMAKYSYLSPYNFVSNSPISMVDPDGRDNVIYLIVLPSANAQLKSGDIESIAKNANENFKNMGLNTRVVVFSSKGPLPPAFDIKNIDKTDAIAVIGGNRKSTTEFIKNISTTQGEHLEKTWLPEKSVNPEVSENPGKIIALSIPDIKSFAKDADASIAEAGGLLINHGAGHNAGMGHDVFGGDIMDDGNFMMGFVWGYDLETGKKIDNPEYKKLTDFIKPEKNTGYKKGMEKRFGTNISKDNYEKNENKKSVYE
jgi:RHS repeat-associated protein